MLEYKGLVSELSVDCEANIIFGKIANVKDIITYEGKTYQEAKEAFFEAVDDYLEWMDELGHDVELLPEPDGGWKNPIETYTCGNRTVFLIAHEGIGGIMGATHDEDYNWTDAIGCCPAEVLSKLDCLL